jgi:hypothetical protein
LSPEIVIAYGAQGRLVQEKGRQEKRSLDLLRSNRDLGKRFVTFAKTSRGVK